jgi:hypothetical protein
VKWLRGDNYHQVSECKQWTINKTGGPNPIYMLVRNGKPDRIVKVGTLAECQAAASAT